MLMLVANGNADIQVEAIWYKTTRERERQNDGNDMIDCLLL